MEQHGGMRMLGPMFSTEEIAEQRRIHLRIGCEDCFRDAVHVLVAFAVKGVLAEHQAIVRSLLETPDPRYPSCLHVHHL